jgi:hypothetical protein
MKQAVQVKTQVVAGINYFIKVTAALSCISMCAVRESLRARVSHERIRYCQPLTKYVVLSWKGRCERW